MVFGPECLFGFVSEGAFSFAGTTYRRAPALQAGEGGTTNATAIPDGMRE